MITLTAKITLEDGSVIDIDKRNVHAIEDIIIDRGNISLPSYGVISNGGKIDFIDFDGKVKEYADNNRLVAGLNAEIFLTDTITKANVKFANYITKAWDYDSISKEVGVTLTDGLEKWQDIQVNGFRLSNEMTGLGIYNYLKEKSLESISFPCEFEELDDTSYSILENYIIVYPFLEKANLWAQWNKLCSACGLYLYKNREGNVTLKYDFQR